MSIVHFYICINNYQRVTLSYMGIYEELKILATNIDNVLRIS